MDEKTPRIPGRSILVGVGLFVVLAVIITLALAGTNVRTYESGTPEAIAQAYLQALFDEDVETAHGFLSPELQTKCEPDDLELWWVRRADSASFDEIRSDGAHAEIELRLTSSDYDVGVFSFDNYDYSRQTELELDRLGGEWVITDATWPLAGCTWR